MKLGQLITLFKSDGATCEACGGPFTCGASLTGCWCAEIKLSDETRAELKSRYDKCLCRGCLERLAEHGSATSGGSVESERI